MGRAQLVFGLGAAAALTRGPEDVTDALATLVADCAAGLGAAAVAVMTRDGDDSRVALLSATSHRAAEIEMLQIQHDRGPCVECLRTDRMVRASCLLYTSPSPRDQRGSRMPSSA